METPDVSSEPPVQPTPVQRASAGLSFGDGFQFGCGFFVAALVAALVFLLLLALIGLVLSLTGAGVLQRLLGGG